MGRYIYRRFLQSLAALLILSLIVFLLARASGNPVDLMLPADATIQDRERMIQKLGLSPVCGLIGDLRYHDDLVSTIDSGLGIISLYEMLAS